MAWIVVGQGRDGYLAAGCQWRDSLLELMWTMLAILGGCNLLASLASFVTVRTDLGGSMRIQRQPYHPRVIWRRLPIVSLNLATVAVFVVIGLALGHAAFDLQWQGLPSVVGQFLFLVFLDDAYFYFFHRSLHRNAYLYRTIHHIHHRATAPFALEYIYVHPLEWMIRALAVPVGLGVIYLVHGSVSAHAFWAFGFWFNLHEIDIHTGLRSYISRSIPWYGTTEHHDRHHAHKNGNFGSTFTIWDRLLKTSISPAS